MMKKRVMTKMLAFGNNVTGYDTRQLATALKRMGLISAFMYSIPGPKMSWQFGEVGYDFSINYCTNGTTSSNCRTDPKPVRWDYYLNADRRALYDVNKAMMNLHQRILYMHRYLLRAISVGTWADW